MENAETKLSYDDQIQEDLKDFRSLTSKLKKLCADRGLPCEIKYNVFTTKWRIDIESIVPMESFHVESRAMDVNAMLGSAIRHMEKLG